MQCLGNYPLFSLPISHNTFLLPSVLCMNLFAVCVWVFFFNWSIGTLQCCVNFCCTMKWISYLYTCIPPSSNSAHPTCLHLHKAPPVLYNRFPLAIYFPHGSVYLSILLSRFVAPSPSPLRPHVPSRCWCVCCALEASVCQFAVRIQRSGDPLWDQRRNGLKCQDLRFALNLSYDLKWFTSLCFSFSKCINRFSAAVEIAWGMCACSIAQSYPTVTPLDCSFSVHVILHIRILEWVAISYSRRSSWPWSNPGLLNLLHWQVDSLPLRHMRSP